MPTVTIEHGPGLLTTTEIEVSSVNHVGKGKIVLGDYLSGRRLAVLVDGEQGIGNPFHFSDGQTRYLGCRIVKLGTKDGCVIDFMQTEPIP